MKNVELLEMIKGVVGPEKFKILIEKLKGNTVVFNKKPKIYKDVIIKLYNNGFLNRKELATKAGCSEHHVGLILRTYKNK